MTKKRHCKIILFSKTTLMLRLMLIELEFTLKLEITLVTLVAQNSMAFEFMFSQRIYLSEFCLALLASKWFFTSVYQHVGLQMLFESKSFRTSWALEFFFAVTLHMLVKSALVGKHFGTDRA